MQWQIGFGHGPTGDVVCVLSLTTPQFTTQVAFSPEDMDKLGRGLIDGARQARTGLVIPAGLAVSTSQPNQDGGKS